MKTTLIIVGILVAVIGIGLWNMGVFQKIEFTEQEIGPMNLVYLEHKGPFHKIAQKIEEVKKYLEENKISYTEPLGEYLDDPQKVKAEELRSNAAFIVNKLPRVKPPFKTKTVKKKKYITAAFTGSPMVGAIMVYPKAMKWLQQNCYEISGPVIEKYKMEGKKTRTEYLFEFKAVKK